MDAFCCKQFSICLLESFVELVDLSSIEMLEYYSYSTPTAVKLDPFVSPVCASCALTVV